MFESRSFKSNRREVNRIILTAPALFLAKKTVARTITNQHIRILHTNDTHSRILPFEKGQYKGLAGVSKRAGLIQQKRKEQPNTLLFDAGDIFQGTTWFSRYHGSVDIKVMQAMGYDAISLGNHDLDLGVANLVQQLKFAPSMSVLSANYSIEATSALKDVVKRHHIYKFGTTKVGVFGLGIAFAGLVNPKLHQGLSYTDPREAVKKSVEFLYAQGCSLIICLSHLGYSGFRGEVGDIDWPKDVPGVHYVVSGHTHTFMEQAEKVKHKSGFETHVMQVGHSGIFLGQADFIIDPTKKTASLQQNKKNTVA